MLFSSRPLLILLFSTLLFLVCNVSVRSQDITERGGLLQFKPLQELVYSVVISHRTGSVSRNVDGKSQAPLQQISRVRTRAILHTLPCYNPDRNSTIDWLELRLDEVSSQGITASQETLDIMQRARKFPLRISSNRITGEIGEHLIFSPVDDKESRELKKSIASMFHLPNLSTITNSTTVHDGDRKWKKRWIVEEENEVHKYSYENDTSSILFNEECAPFQIDIEMKDVKINKKLRGEPQVNDLQTQQRKYSNRTLHINKSDYTIHRGSNTQTVDVFMPSLTHVPNTDDRTKIRVVATLQMKLLKVRSRPITPKLVDTCPQVQEDSISTSSFLEISSKKKNLLQLSQQASVSHSIRQGRGHPQAQKMLLELRIVRALLAKVSPRDEEEETASRIKNSKIGQNFENVYRSVEKMLHLLEPFRQETSSDQEKLASRPAGDVESENVLNDKNFVEVRAQTVAALIYDEISSFSDSLGALDSDASKHSPTFSIAIQEAGILGALHRVSTALTRIREGGLCSKTKLMKLEQHSSTFLANLAKRIKEFIEKAEETEKTLNNFLELIPSMMPCVDNEQKVLAFGGGFGNCKAVRKGSVEQVSRQLMRSPGMLAFIGDKKKDSSPQAKGEHQKCLIETGRPCGGIFKRSCPGNAGATVCCAKSDDERCTGESSIEEIASKETMEENRCICQKGYCAVPDRPELGADSALTCIPEADLPNAARVLGQDLIGSILDRGNNLLTSLEKLRDAEFIINEEVTKQFAIDGGSWIAGWHGLVQSPALASCGVIMWEREWKKTFGDEKFLEVGFTAEASMLFGAAAEGSTETFTSKNFRFEQTSNQVDHTKSDDEAKEAKRDVARLLFKKASEAIANGKLSNPLDLQTPEATKEDIDAARKAMETGELDALDNPLPAPPAAVQDEEAKQCSDIDDAEQCNTDSRCTFALSECHAPSNAQDEVKDACNAWQDQVRNEESAGEDENASKTDEEKCTSVHKECIYFKAACLSKCEYIESPTEETCIRKQRENAPHCHFTPEKCNASKDAGKDVHDACANYLNREETSDEEAEKTSSEKCAAAHQSCSFSPSLCTTHSSCTGVQLPITNKNCLKSNGCEYIAQSCMATGYSHECVAPADAEESVVEACKSWDTSASDETKTPEDHCAEANPKCIYRDLSKICGSEVKDEEECSTIARRSEIQRLENRIKKAADALTARKEIEEELKEKAKTIEGHEKVGDVQLGGGFSIQIGRALEGKDSKLLQEELDNLKKNLETVKAESKGLCSYKPARCDDYVKTVTKHRAEIYAEGRLAMHMDLAGFNKATRAMTLEFNPILSTAAPKEGDGDASRMKELKESLKPILTILGTEMVLDDSPEAILKQIGKLIAKKSQHHVAKAGSSNAIMLARLFVKARCLLLEKDGSTEHNGMSADGKSPPAPGKELEKARGGGFGAIEELGNWIKALRGGIATPLNAFVEKTKNGLGCDVLHPVTEFLVHLDTALAQIQAVVEAFGCQGAAQAQGGSEMVEKRMDALPSPSKLAENMKKSFEAAKTALQKFEETGDTIRHCIGELNAVFVKTCSDGFEVDFIPAVRDLLKNSKRMIDTIKDAGAFLKRLSNPVEMAKIVKSAIHDDLSMDDVRGNGKKGELWELGNTAVTNLNNSEEVLRDLSENNLVKHCAPSASSLLKYVADGIDNAGENLQRLLKQRLLNMLVKARCYAMEKFQDDDDDESKEHDAPSGNIEEFAGRLGALRHALKRFGDQIADYEVKFPEITPLRQKCKRLTKVKDAMKEVDDALQLLQQIAGALGCGETPVTQKSIKTDVIVNVSGTVEVEDDDKMMRMRFLHSDSEGESVEPGKAGSRDIAVTGGDATKSFKVNDRVYTATGQLIGRITNVTKQLLTFDEMTLVDVKDNDILYKESGSDAIDRRIRELKVGNIAEAYAYLQSAAMRAKKELLQLKNQELFPKECRTILEITCDKPESSKNYSDQIIRNEGHQIVFDGITTGHALIQDILGIVHSKHKIKIGYEGLKNSRMDKKLIKALSSGQVTEYETHYKNLDSGLENLEGKLSSSSTNLLVASCLPKASKALELSSVAVAHVRQRLSTIAAMISMLVRRIRNVIEKIKNLLKDLKMAEKCVVKLTVDKIKKLREGLHGVENADGFCEKTKLFNSAMVELDKGNECISFFRDRIHVYGAYEKASGSGCDHKKTDHDNCCTTSNKCGNDEGYCEEDNQCLDGLSCSGKCSWADEDDTSAKCCTWNDQVSLALEDALEHGNVQGQKAAKKLKAILKVSNRGYQYVVGGCDLKDSIMKLVGHMKAVIDEPAVALKDTLEGKPNGEVQKARQEFGKNLMHLQKLVKMLLHDLRSGGFKESNAIVSRLVFVEKVLGHALGVLHQLPNGFDGVVREMMSDVIDKLNNEVIDPSNTQVGAFATKNLSVWMKQRAPVSRVFAELEPLLAVMEELSSTIFKNADTATKYLYGSRPVETTETDVEVTRLLEGEIQALHEALPNATLEQRNHILKELERNRGELQDRAAIQSIESDGIHTANEEEMSSLHGPSRDLKAGLVSVLDVIKKMRKIANKAKSNLVSDKKDLDLISTGEETLQIPETFPLHLLHIAIRRLQSHAADWVVSQCTLREHYLHSDLDTKIELNKTGNDLTWNKVVSSLEHSRNGRNAMEILLSVVSTEKFIKHRFRRDEAFAKGVPTVEDTSLDESQLKVSKLLLLSTDMQDKLFELGEKFHTDELRRDDTQRILENWVTQFGEKMCREAADEITGISLLLTRWSSMVIALQSLGIDLGKHIFSVQQLSDETDSARFDNFFDGEASRTQEGSFFTKAHVNLRKIRVLLADIHNNPIMQGQQINIAWLTWIDSFRDNGLNTSNGLLQTEDDGSASSQQAKISMESTELELKNISLSIDCSLGLLSYVTTQIKGIIGEAQLVQTKTLSSEAMIGLHSKLRSLSQEYSHSYGTRTCFDFLDETKSGLSTTTLSQGVQGLNSISSQQDSVKIIPGQPVLRLPHCLTQHLPNMMEHIALAARTADKLLKSRDIREKLKEKQEKLKLQFARAQHFISIVRRCFARPFQSKQSACFAKSQSNRKHSDACKLHTKKRNCDNARHCIWAEKVFLDKDEEKPTGFVPRNNWERDEMAMNKNPELWAEGRLKYAGYVDANSGVCVASKGSKVKSCPKHKSPIDCEAGSGCVWGRKPTKPNTLEARKFANDRGQIQKAVEILDLQADALDRIEKTCKVLIEKSAANRAIFLGNILGAIVGGKEESEKKVTWSSESKKSEITMAIKCQKQEAPQSAGWNHIYANDLEIFNATIGPILLIGVPLTMQVSFGADILISLQYGMCGGLLRPSHTLANGTLDRVKQAYPYVAIAPVLDTSLYAEARVAVGIPMLNMGVGLEVQLAKLATPFQLDVQVGEPALAFEVNPKFGALSGHIYSFINILKKEKELTLYGWKGFSKQGQAYCVTKDIAADRRKKLSSEKDRILDLLDPDFNPCESSDAEEIELLSAGESDGKMEKTIANLKQRPALCSHCVSCIFHPAINNKYEHLPHKRDAFTCPMDPARYAALAGSPNTSALLNSWLSRFVVDSCKPDISDQIKVSRVQLTKEALKNGLDEPDAAKVKEEKEAIIKNHYKSFQNPESAYKEEKKRRRDVCRGKGYDGVSEKKEKTRHCCFGKPSEDENCDASPDCTLRERTTKRSIDIMSVCNESYTILQNEGNGHVINEYTVLVNLKWKDSGRIDSKFRVRFRPSVLLAKKVNVQYELYYRVYRTKDKYNMMKKSVTEWISPMSHRWVRCMARVDSTTIVRAINGVSIHQCHRNKSKSTCTSARKCEWKEFDESNKEWPNKIFTMNQTDEVVDVKVLSTCGYPSDPRCNENDLRRTDQGNWPGFYRMQSGGSWYDVESILLKGWFPETFSYDNLLSNYPHLQGGKFSDYDKKSIDHGRTFRDAATQTVPEFTFEDARFLKKDALQEVMWPKLSTKYPSTEVGEECQCEGAVRSAGVSNFHGEPIFFASLPQLVPLDRAGLKCEPWHINHLDNNLASDVDVHGFPEDFRSQIKHFGNEGYECYCSTAMGRNLSWDPRNLIPQVRQFWGSIAFNTAMSSTCYRGGKNFPSTTCPLHSGGGCPLASWDHIENQLDMIRTSLRAVSVDPNGKSLPYVYERNSNLVNQQNRWRKSLTLLPSLSIQNASDDRGAVLQKNGEKYLSQILNQGNNLVYVGSVRLSIIETDPPLEKLTRLKDWDNVKIMVQVSVGGGEILNAAGNEWEDDFGSTSPKYEDAEEMMSCWVVSKSFSEWRKTYQSLREKLIDLMNPTDDGVLLRGLAYFGGTTELLPDDSITELEKMSTVAERWRILPRWEEVETMEKWDQDCSTSDSVKEDFLGVLTKIAKLAAKRFHHQGFFEEVSDRLNSTLLKVMEVNGVQDGHEVCNIQSAITKVAVLNEMLHAMSQAFELRSLRELPLLWQAAESRDDAVWTGEERSESAYTNIGLNRHQEESNNLPWNSDEEFKTFSDISGNFRIELGEFIKKCENERKAQRKLCLEALASFGELFSQLYQNIDPMSEDELKAGREIAIQMNHPILKQSGGEALIKAAQFRYTGEDPYRENAKTYHLPSETRSFQITDQVTKKTHTAKGFSGRWAVELCNDVKKKVSIAFHKIGKNDGWQHLCNEGNQRREFMHQRKILQKQTPTHAKPGTISERVRDLSCGRHPQACLTTLLSPFQRELQFEDYLVPYSSSIIERVPCKRFDCSHDDDAEAPPDKVAALHWREQPGTSTKDSLFRHDQETLSVDKQGTQLRIIPFEIGRVVRNGNFCGRRNSVRIQKFFRCRRCLMKNEGQTSIHYEQSSHHTIFCPTLNLCLTGKHHCPVKFSTIGPDNESVPTAVLNDVTKCSQLFPNKLYDRFKAKGDTTEWMDGDGMPKKVYKVNYVGFDSQWDDWIDCDSPRLRAHMGKRNLEIGDELDGVLSLTNTFRKVKIVEICDEFEDKKNGHCPCLCKDKYVEGEIQTMDYKRCCCTGDCPVEPDPGSRFRSRKAQLVLKTSTKNEMKNRRQRSKYGEDDINGKSRTEVDRSERALPKQNICSYHRKLRECKQAQSKTECENSCTSQTGHFDDYKCKFGIKPGSGEKTKRCFSAHHLSGRELKSFQCHDTCGSLSSKPENHFLVADILTTRASIGVKVDLSASSMAKEWLELEDVDWSIEVTLQGSDETMWQYRIVKSFKDIKRLYENLRRLPVLLINGVKLPERFTNWDNPDSQHRDAVSLNKLIRRVFSESESDDDMEDDLEKEHVREIYNKNGEENAFDKILKCTVIDNLFNDRNAASGDVTPQYCLRKRRMALQGVMDYLVSHRLVRQTAIFQAFLNIDTHMIDLVAPRVHGLRKIRSGLGPTAAYATGMCFECSVFEDGKVVCPRAGSRARKSFSEMLSDLLPAPPQPLLDFGASECLRAAREGNCDKDKLSLQDESSGMTSDGSDEKFDKTQSELCLADAKETSEAAKLVLGEGARVFSCDESVTVDGTYAAILAISNESTDSDVRFLRIQISHACAEHNSFSDGPAFSPLAFQSELRHWASKKSRLENYREWMYEKCSISDVTRILGFSTSSRDRVMKQLYEASKEEIQRKSAAAAPCRPSILLAPRRPSGSGLGGFTGTGGLLRSGVALGSITLSKEDVSVAVVSSSTRSRRCIRCLAGAKSCGQSKEDRLSQIAALRLPRRILYDTKQDAKEKMKTRSKKDRYINLASEEILHVALETIKMKVVGDKDDEVDWWLCDERIYWQQSKKEELLEHPLMKEKSTQKKAPLSGDEVETEARAEAEAEHHEGTITGPLLHAGVACRVSDVFARECYRFVSSWKKDLDVVLQRKGHGNIVYVPMKDTGADDLDSQYYYLLDKTISFYNYQKSPHKFFEDHFAIEQECNAVPEGINVILD
eukprot:g396.t1